MYLNLNVFKCIYMSCMLLMSIMYSILLYRTTELYIYYIYIYITVHCRTYIMINYVWLCTVHIHIFSSVLCVILSVQIYTHMHFLIIVQFFHGAILADGKPQCKLTGNDCIRAVRSKSLICSFLASCLRVCVSTPVSEVFNFLLCRGRKNLWSVLRQRRHSPLVV